LSTDDTNGYMSRLADNTEAIQLGLAGELLAHASELLAEGKVASGDVRVLARDLAEALRTTLRVAVSRGQRLSRPDSTDPDPDLDPDRGDDEPQLPTSAFA
jgi:hypothetical protein